MHSLAHHGTQWRRGACVFGCVVRVCLGLERYRVPGIGWNFCQDEPKHGEQKPQYPDKATLQRRLKTMRQNRATGLDWKTFEIQQDYLPFSPCQKQHFLSEVWRPWTLFHWPKLWHLLKKSGDLSGCRVSDIWLRTEQKQSFSSNQTSLWITTTGSKIYWGSYMHGKEK